MVLGWAALIALDSSAAVLWVSGSGYKCGGGMFPQASWEDRAATDKAAAAEARR